MKDFFGYIGGGVLFTLGLTMLMISIVEEKVNDVDFSWFLSICCVMLILIGLEIFIHTIIKREINSHARREH